MNTNEAPEKVYISLRPGISGGYVYTTVNKDFPNAVEYTSTDAFIEKAEIYLKGKLLRYIDLCVRGVGISTEEFIEKFKKYLKEG